MSARTFAAVLMKVWGVFWLVSSVIGFANVIVEFFTRPFAASDPGMQQFSLFSSAATTMVTFGAALVLIRFGDLVAGAIIRTGEDGLLLGLSASQMEAVLFGTLGAYLTVSGFRQAAVLAYELLRRSSWDQPGKLEYIWQNRQGELVGSVVQLIAGSALVLGRKGLAEAWKRVHPMEGDEETVSPPTDTAA